MLASYLPSTHCMLPFSIGQRVDWYHDQQEGHLKLEGDATMTLSAKIIVLTVTFTVNSDVMWRFIPLDPSQPSIPIITDEHICLSKISETTNFNAHELINTCCRKGYRERGCRLHAAAVKASTSQVAGDSSSVAGEISLHRQTLHLPVASCHMRIATQR